MKRTSLNLPMIIHWPVINKTYALSQCETDPEYVASVNLVDGKRNPTYGKKCGLIGDINRGDIIVLAEPQTTTVQLDIVADTSALVEAKKAADALADSLAKVKGMLA